ncbi:hypothetical protein [Halorubrum distributum]|uniref:Uncharacterized protein n=1 Tax=Halorubrum distributum JCM 10247 TaxID=1227486 RepID=M0D4I9_9EURY|nr:hypothetical protein [Halorubrum terrestre]ELZ30370.1 hypothetical protein C473_13269 [Halorubrum terrestre JCM 10247]
MSWLLDALSALGAGQQVLMGAMLLMGALYILKVVKIGKVIGDTVSSGAAYGIAILVVGGVAIALGWVDPNVSAMTSQLGTFADTVWSAIGDWVIEQTLGRLEATV